MKVFLCISLIAIIAGSALGSPTGQSPAGANVELENVEQESFPMVPLRGDLNRYRKSYGSSVPAPPCPKNYLFSCSPNLSPVPCVSGGGYGSSGSYTAPVPVYLAPMGTNFNAAVPQLYQN